MSSGSPAQLSRLAAKASLSRHLLQSVLQALNSLTHLTTSAMSLPARTATSLVRHTARQQLPALRASAAATQKRNRADASLPAASTSHAEFRSPFHRGTSNEQDTTVMPNWGKYKASGGETTNKMFQYFMVGAFGGLSALGAKNTVQGSHRTPLNEDHGIG